MKRRRITAATNNVMSKVTARFEEQLDNELYKVKYEVKCTGTLPNVKITVKCIDKEHKMMPTIKLAVDEFESGMFGVIPTLTFPTLTFENNDYADTIHYWLDRWEKVGKCITELNKIEFDLDAAIEDEESGE